MASIPRETGRLDHEHPQLAIDQRIRHVQQQGDPIGLAECQRLYAHFQKMNRYMFNMQTEIDRHIHRHVHTYILLVPHERNVGHWIRAQKRGRRFTVCPAHKNMND